MLTARDAQEDLVRGLDRGADDYLTKPFELAELLARCRAVVRRANGQAASKIDIGPVRLDLAARRADLEGHPIELTEMEYIIVELLGLRRGQIVSKAQIADQLYSYGCERTSNVIEVYISGLRKKLGADLIQTQRGRGYLIEAAL